jgi:hypothetical protein
MYKVLDDQTKTMQKFGKKLRMVEVQEYQGVT